MNTKICKYCKEEIAKKAKRCPKCGGKFGMPGWAIVLIVVAIIIFLIAACTNGLSNSIKEVKNSYNDINGKTSFNINESFQNKYEKITMTEINLNFTDYNEYLGPKEGNKFIAVKFEVENIGDGDEIYVSSLSFSAYADGVAAEQYIYAYDKYSDVTATVGKGKKTIGYVLYQVPINSEKIVIEYNADFWIDGNTIEFIVK